MRIVVINATTDLYGSNRVLSLALRSFPANCKLQLLLPELNGPLIDFMEKNNPEVDIRLCRSLPIIQRKMFSVTGGVQVIKLLINFYRFLKAENNKEAIDLIYVNTLSNFFVLPVAHYLKIKTVAHIHEILVSPKIVSQFINKKALKWSSSILAVSDAVKQNLIQSNASADRNKITVMHNGIPDLYAPNHYVQRSSSKVFITLIARIIPEKGIWYFLEALSLLKNHQEVSARIIGGAAPFGEKYVEQLKRDIPKIGMVIEYIPFIPDVKKYVNETDIMVVPSIGKESFPTTVLEGMSAGKAVIATNTGGATEAIVHGKSGFLIKNDDPENFAQILTRLITDEHLRTEIGKEARKRYLKNYTLEVFHKKMQKFIQQEIRK
jgi:glycosyltransferase involved in cell wall biosynthesis